MASVSKECEQCGEFYGGEANGVAISCPKCGVETIVVAANDWSFKKCAYCDCKQLYKRKDFNQLIGCLIILVGAFFVPFTYGISLIALSIFDYLLYRRVPEILVCYKCGTEFRGFGVIPVAIDQFDHHIAELYEI